MVDSVGPGDAHHLAPSVEQEVALLVVVAGLSVKPRRVICQLRSGESTWRITVVAGLVLLLTELTSTSLVNV